MQHTPRATVICSLIKNPAQLRSGHGTAGIEGMQDRSERTAVAIDSEDATQGSEFKTISPRIIRGRLVPADDNDLPGVHVVEGEMPLLAGEGYMIDYRIDSDEDDEDDIPLEEIDLNQKSAGLEQIERFIDKDAAAVAQLLRNWLSDE